MFWRGDLLAVDLLAVDLLAGTERGLAIDLLAGTETEFLDNFTKVWARTFRRETAMWLCGKVWARTFRRGCLPGRTSRSSIITSRRLHYLVPDEMHYSPIAFRRRCKQIPDFKKMILPGSCSDFDFSFLFLRAKCFLVCFFCERSFSNLSGLFFGYDAFPYNHCH